jgi:heme a synthase
MNSRATLIRPLVLAAFVLAFIVVVLGAYVRLSAAGLGCPDWPGCYGHLTPSGAEQEVASGALGGATVEVGKAWREMIHRYAAGTLGLIIFLITALAIQYRRERIVRIPYVLGLLGLVIAQGLLGMLTVTWQLKPLIVTAHLLFGLATLSVLWWLALTLMRQHASAWRAAIPFLGSSLPRTRQLALLALVVLALQLALGGWTSSNYAAIACPDVPKCQRAWWPAMDGGNAFVLWRGLGINYEGGVLAQPARVAIHFAHRLGALLASAFLLLAAIRVLRIRSDRFARLAALFVLAALALQLTIGISMVSLGFPLWIATAHNAGAALLLLAVVALNRALRPA